MTGRSFHDSQVSRQEFTSSFSFGVIEILDLYLYILRIFILFDTNMSALAKPN